MCNGICLINKTWTICAHMRGRVKGGGHYHHHLRLLLSTVPGLRGTDSSGLNLARCFSGAPVHAGCCGIGILSRGFHTARPSATFSFGEKCSSPNRGLTPPQWGVLTSLKAVGYNGNKLFPILTLALLNNTYPESRKEINTLPNTYAHHDQSQWKIEQTM